MSDVKKYKDERQFENTPEGWARRWDVEMDAGLAALEEFHKAGKMIVDRFLDKRSGGDQKARINLFTSNSQTTRAFLFGKTPKVDVTRRYGDQNDPIGRAAGETLQRMLNTDIERQDDTFSRAMRYALSDRLLPGLGIVKLRYEPNIRATKVDPRYRTDEEGNVVKDKKTKKPVVLAEGYTKEEKCDEDAICDYYHWNDVVWNAGARIWEEVRWLAFRNPMTRAALRDRFLPVLTKAYDGDKRKANKAINAIPLTSAMNKQGEDDKKDTKHTDPWARADVWEIWDKEHKKVWWWVDGFPEILDDKSDPLELRAFWPCPMPMFANLTTDELIPRPDFIIAQDLYNEIDEVTARIRELERAIIVRGVYNSAMPGVQRLLQEGMLNQLLPIEEWPAFQEKGGLKGNIEWLPLEATVAALQILRDYRKELISLSQQVTGMSDILRGESSDRATATEQAIKAKFASVRLQDFQDEFARFASETQAIRAEIIVNFFDDQTIIERSNVLATADAQYARPQPDPRNPGEFKIPLIEMLRSSILWYRIQIKPESISATDYGSMQEERTKALQTVSTFMQAMLPLGQAAPELMPFMVEMLRWLFVAFRGGAAIEGIMDQVAKQVEGMVQQAIQKRSQPPQPSPDEQIKLEGTKAKAEAEISKAHIDVQGAQQDHALKTQQALMEHDLNKHKIEQEKQQSALEGALSMRKTESQMRLEALKTMGKLIPMPTKPGASK
jgi:hypothetical protein